MKNQFKRELWTPVVPEHPEPSRGYRKSKTESFLEYQPLSERYQVPGLLPRVPSKQNDTEN